MEAWGSKSLNPRLAHLVFCAAIALAAPASASFKAVAEFGAPKLGELVAPIDIERDGGGNTYVLNAPGPAVTRFDATGTPVLRFGSPGTGPGQFESPTAMGVNESTGEIYVSDLSTSAGTLSFRIQRFDSDGEFLGQWGAPGTAEGQFSDFILGIAVNSTTGDVYVAERSRIQRFNADGQFELMWGKDVVPGGGTGPETCAAGCKEAEDGTFEGEFDGLTGIASIGNVVFTTESDNARVQRFNATTGAFQLMAGRDVDPAGGMGAETCIAGCKRGMQGSGPGELADPGGIDVNGAAARLWIADQGNERIQRWDSVLMTYQTEFGSAGAGQGQFVQPRSLVEGGGSVLVADTTLSRVQSFDSATSAFQSSFGTPGVGTTVVPRSLATGPGGIFVTDAPDRVLRFNPDGSLILRFGGPGAGPGDFDGPAGVAVAADGTVYVADLGNHRIQRFEDDGDPLGQWGSFGGAAGQFRNPNDVAVGPDGTVYVADSSNNRIQTFTPAGGFLSQWGSAGTEPGQFNFPTGLAIDADGNVYVADASNDRIQKFAADGTFITQWGHSGRGNGEFNGPRDVAADGAGNVFVADAENNRIQRFSSDGAFIEAIGAPGISAYGDGPSEFRLPFSVATDAQGFVYVADSFNNRIQRLVGEPELVLSGKRKQRYKRQTIGVDCVTGPCAVAISGKVKLTEPRDRRALARKPKIKLKAVRLSLVSGATATADLRFRKAAKARRVLRALLSDGGKAKLTVRATATNEAGTATATRTIKLKRRQLRGH
jgi:sugar lactone lactonase YvrE